MTIALQFVHSNIKNISTSHISFELNYKYYFCIFYKKNINSKFKFKFIDILANNLKIYITLLRKKIFK